MMAVAMGLVPLCNTLGRKCYLILSLAFTSCMVSHMILLPNCELGQAAAPSPP